MTTCHDTLRLAEQLIARPSVTPDDAGCMDLIAEALKPLGFDCEFIDSGPETFLLSKTNSTLERLAGLRVVVPLKITSCMDSPRSSDALDSPSTQRTASMMLDLPQPLGPTTPTSWPGSMKLVGSANDLKPESLMELRRTAVGWYFY